MFHGMHVAVEKASAVISKYILLPMIIINKRATFSALVFLS
jgi:hypothetical protein